ncbi:MAG: DUF4347 domain-containing protein [Spirulinaceae cyanobacterium]
MYSAIQSSSHSSVSALPTATALVVIDPRVDAPEQLVAGLRPGARALVLDPTQDGVAQVTRALAAEQYDSLHLVAHGSPGRLPLGAGVLSLETLRQYRQQLLEWGVAEIWVYGCGVAAQPQMLRELHELTGAAVAASAVAVGRGNWLLEWQAGEVRAEAVFTGELAASYMHTFMPDSELAKDIKDNTGLTNDSNPTNLTTVDNKLFFLADDGTGIGLWVSEGSPVTTHKILDGINRDIQESSLNVIGDELYFVVSTGGKKELWATDGDPSNAPNNPKRTRKIMGDAEEISNDMVLFNNQIYFGASEGGSIGLWVTNGSEGNASFLLSNSDATSTNNQFIVIGNGTTEETLFFSVEEDLYGLAKTGQPFLVHDNSSSFYTGVLDVVGLNEKLVYLSEEGILNEQNNVYIYANGIKEKLLTGNTGFGIGSLTVIGDQLFFEAVSDNVRALRVYEDGSNGQISIVKDVNDNIIRFTDNLTPVGTKLFFTASMLNSGIELWVVDTVGSGTAKMVRDINETSGVGSTPEQLTVVGDKLFFVADDGNNGKELWVSDGNTAQIVKDLNPNQNGKEPAQLTVADNKLFFIAEDNEGLNLYVTEGDSSSTHRVKDLLGGFFPSITLDSTLEVVGNRLYFRGDDTTSPNNYGKEVWSINITDLGSGSSNSAPTLTGPTSESIDENTTFVTDLEASDDTSTEGGSSSLTYRITGGDDAALFQWEDASNSQDSPTGRLEFISPPDFETPTDQNNDGTYQIEVSAIDGEGLLSDPLAISVTVDDIAETPTGPNQRPQLQIDDTNNKVLVPENTTGFVFDVNTLDDNDSEGNGLIYEPLGGPDANFFTIDPVNGHITFNPPPDFENPLDGNGIHTPNNIYDIEITVTDSGGLQDRRSMWFEVQDVVETENIPVINSLTSFTLLENNAYIGDINSSDDLNAEGNGITYSISGGADAASFAINAATGELSLNTLPDYEGQQTYSVDVVATDQADLTSAPQTITVNVGDIAETIDPTVTGTNQGDPAFQGGAGNDTYFGLGGDDLQIFGGDDHDTLYGDDGNDRLWGDNGGDRLFGGRDRDQLWGGNGDDQLQGDDGNDDLLGEAGNDILRGGAGTDLLLGGNDNDQLYGDQDNDTLRGEHGNDILDGGDGVDNIDGGDGHDYILGGSGNDSLRGWYGNDVIEGGTGNDHILGDWGNDIINGGNDHDALEGRTGDDHLYGGSGDDTIYGNENNDHLYGEDGVDFLHGGLGNDHLNGGNQNDTLWGLEGEDQLHGGTGDDYLNGGQGKDILYGGDGVDELRGEGENDELYGGNQNDTLFGGNGIDYLYGEAGDDTLWGDNDKDYLYGGGGSDTLEGGGGDDELYGGAGNDTLIGSWGNNHLYGEDGDDHLEGFHNVDVLRGGDGDDFLDGGGDNDELYGEADDDELRGWWGDDQLYGGDGVDTLFGYHGNDTLYGDAGNDFLYGERDSDTLNGGLGDDLLDGGSESDTFVFNVDQFGFDQIINFENGIDKVDLTYFNGSLSLGSLDSNSDNWVNADDGLSTLANGSLHIAVGGGTIQFNGHTQVAITDFVV